MPERKKVRSGIFYLIKILHQPSSGKNTRNNLLFSVLLRKYWSTAKEVLTIDFS